MDRRSGATPMDFAYDNITGPTDMTSPFMSVGRQAKPGVKRTHSAFNSPSKPQIFGLREPNGNSHLFSLNPQQGRDKPLPAEPRRSFDPRFDTPRKMEVDFSSGGETPDTDRNPDSEANTPDVIKKRSVTQIFKGTTLKTSPTKERRESFFGKLFSSPSRGEIAKNYSSKGEKLVRRRRKKELDRALARRGPHEEDENDTQDSKKQKNNNESGNDRAGEQAPKGSAIAAILSFVHEHPNLPHILTWYLQFIFNGFLLCVCMYAIWCFWSTIMGEVNKESDKVVAQTLVEIASCAKDYRDNRCDPPGSRAPALERACNNWEKCMNQDPYAVGRASVSAHTFAHIFNSLIEPISYKAMFFFLILTFGSIFISNAAFGFIRSKTAPQYGHQHQGYMQAQPPATPQRYPSGGQFYTPYHSQANYGLEPAPSLQPASEMPMESRPKALGY